MRQIGVAVDEIAEKGAVIGLTGKTCMAGRDNPHFSILVNGISHSLSGGINSGCS